MMDSLELLICCVFLDALMTFFAAIELKGLRDELCELDYDLMQLNMWWQIHSAHREQITTE